LRISQPALDHSVEPGNGCIFVPQRLFHYLVVFCKDLLKLPFFLHQFGLKLALQQSVALVSIFEGRHDFLELLSFLFRMLEQFVQCFDFAILGCDSLQQSYILTVLLDLFELFHFQPQLFLLPTVSRVVLLMILHLLFELLHHCVRPLQLRL
jgi:hypothetical protein